MNKFERAHSVREADGGWIVENCEGRELYRVDMHPSEIKQLGWSTVTEDGFTRVTLPSRSMTQHRKAESRLEDCGFWHPNTPKPRIPLCLPEKDSTYT